MTIPSPMHPMICTSHNGQGLEASLFGGQLLSWRDADGSELLYLSPLSQAEGKAVRGGIPVCFPQFAARGRLVKHGFARTSNWVQADDAPPGTIRLQLHDGENSRAAWPHRFSLVLDACLTDSGLQVTLSVSNTDRHAWSFTTALHTYLRVDDVSLVQLRGLKGLAYEDALAGGTITTAEEDSPRFGPPVDRVYFDAVRPLTLMKGNDELEIAQEGFSDVVVWNPGPGGAALLGDLPPGDEKRMLCVEAARIANAVELLPGQRWSGTQRIRRVKRA